MNKAIRYIGYVIGSGALVYIAFMFYVSSYTKSSARETWQNMQSSDFQCPNGTEVVHRGWSENGTSRYCEPKKNGPWEAWMSGYKWVDGYYKAGKKHGEWHWYNEEGNVTKTIVYNNGEIVSEVQVQVKPK